MLYSDILHLHIHVSKNINIMNKLWKPNKCPDFLIEILTFSHVSFLDFLSFKLTVLTNLLF